MMTRHKAAPGGGPGAAGDQRGARSDSMLQATSDISDELQLLGCLLRCGSADEVVGMTFAVPPRVFDDRLNAALWRAGEQLAAHGVADAVTVVQSVLVAGLWPRDLHHEVTVRALDAVEGSRFDPWEWRLPALAVLEAHVRRETARRLALVASILPSARVQDVVRGLLDAAEYAEVVIGWIGHVSAGEGVAA